MADAAWRIEVVKRSAEAKGFEVIPRRWVVERTIAWINRCRRLAKDYENLNRTKAHPLLLSLMNLPDGLSHVRFQGSGQSFPLTVLPVSRFEYRRRAWQEARPS
jgi:hypothetical protein